MPATIEPFLDSPSARAELVPFLAGQFQGEGACDEATWLRRLAFWWDENPYAHAHPCRGWLLRSGGRVAGYLGTIPTLYEDAHGTPVPALIATSWAVEEGQRQAALPMGLMLQRQGRSCLLVDTTPSPEVRQMLARWGWRPSTTVRRSLMLRGLSGGMLAGVMGHEPPTMPDGLRVATQAAEVSHIHRVSPPGLVQKHITPDYLRWYLRSPMREHFFTGLVDDSGGLHAHLLLTTRRLRGMPCWKVVDWSSHGSPPELLHFLVCWLMDNAPSEVGAGWPFISLASFPEDPVWAGLPVVFSKEETVCHYHSLPPALADASLRPVMAEGDWGL